jgi:hypothetical protein
MMRLFAVDQTFSRILRVVSIKNLVAPEKFAKSPTQEFEAEFTINRL